MFSFRGTTAVGLFLLVTLGGLASASHARPVNYDEAKVPPYTLPDPLAFRSGAKLASPDEWPQRRAEILALFEDQMYGLIPPRPAKMRLELLESSDILGGRATRKQVRMWFRDDDSGPKIDWIFFIPKNCPGPVPAFLGLNYYGNQELDADPAIRLCEGWLRDNPKHFITNHRASEKSRGLNPKSWPFETLVTRGYALVTACYGDIAPDDKELYTQGVHALFPPTAPGAGNNTTALAAWAWGLMRGMDMLEKEPAIDAKRVAVIGCSRLAKAALLAGAKDERFAVIIANQTGGGGVPLAKRDYGENVSTQNQMFPHWFCENFRQYSDNEAAMPFDQHMLLAACAPRRLYVSGFPGKWFDPYGEFLSMKAAEPVWQFLGLSGLPASEWPEEMSPAMSSHLAYHRRPYEHGIAMYDWQCYLAFTDRAFNKTIDWQPTKTDVWHGFPRHHFEVDGCECWVAVPKHPRPGNHWVWCTEWPEAFAERTGTVRLLEEGFYFIHMKVGTMSLGSPPALAHMDAFYKHIVAKGLNPKGMFTGVSRGGLYAYRFAAAHPDRVVCIYGDAPVCDFKSWPLGATRGRRDEKSVKTLLELYGFKTEAEALAYQGNPIDNLAPLAKAGIPLIHVIGDVDETVPPESNSAIVEQRYKALGGTITVFHKPDCGHHPHGLEDPAPVVDLIKTYTTRWDIENCK
jgi:pimeloyl-ACP methyl ester carboxylesterase